MIFTNFKVILQIVSVLYDDGLFFRPIALILYVFKINQPQKPHLGHISGVFNCQLYIDFARFLCGMTIKRQKLIEK
jgi:hypothetical protein